MNMYDIDFNRTVHFTGHRPNRLYGFDYNTDGNVKIIRKLRALIIRFIEKLGIDTFISGMALGIDMWSAQIVLSLKEKYPHIKLVCAIPCTEQYKRWGKDDIKFYHNILEQADLVHYVSDEPYTKWCMQDRNKWMTDNSKFCIAVWNGEEDGGTWHNVKYAKTRQRSILHLDPKTFKVDFLK